jgi:golgi-specific brefeldin A-resistance guanine nucleotide exchange factor 1
MLNPSCRQLDLDALVAAVRALEALAHERTVAKLKQESDDVLSSSYDAYSLPYDPASVFLLETMVSITCHAISHIENLWCVKAYTRPWISLLKSPRPIVFEHLSALLSASTQYSMLLIERAVVGLLRLCLILAQKVRSFLGLKLKTINTTFFSHLFGIKYMFLLTFSLACLLLSPIPLRNRW